jgi:hypothetical protein
MVAPACFFLLFLYSQQDLKPVAPTCIANGVYLSLSISIRRIGSDVNVEFRVGFLAFSKSTYGGERWGGAYFDHGKAFWGSFSSFYFEVMDGYDTLTKHNSFTLMEGWDGYGGKCKIDWGGDEIFFFFTMGWI